MKRTIKIEIGEDTNTTQEFISAWHRAKQGESPIEPEERIVFEDLETLLRVLTPQRWTLLRTLRKNGPMSIRSLAKILKRDYKNVHTAVKILERTGLLTKNEENQIWVPWKTVIAQVELAA